MEIVTFTYRFIFKNGHKKEYQVRLNAINGNLVSDSSAQEEWTKLEFHKCSHCPLNAKDYPHCPVAQNLAQVAQGFKGDRSYESVAVEVESSERTYKKTLPLQDALFGLFGLIMATSACPYLKFLKPMARFHLPFASIEETYVRSASFYLFRQYIMAKKGKTPDFEMKHFSDLYNNLKFVNRGMIDRIHSMARADADANSIVALDAFASLLPAQVDTAFADVGQLFES